MIAGLSFLGLGVPIPMPEWGSMIQVGANYMVFGKWWLSIFPGLALFLSVWLLNICSRMLQSLWEKRMTELLEVKDLSVSFKGEAVTLAH